LTVFGRSGVNIEQETLGRFSVRSNHVPQCVEFAPIETAVVKHSTQNLAAGVVLLPPKPFVVTGKTDLADSGYNRSNDDTGRSDESDQQILTHWSRTKCEKQIRQSPVTTRRCM
jgi:hypothetical protein